MRLFKGRKGRRSESAGVIGPDEEDLAHWNTGAGAAAMGPTGTGARWAHGRSTGSGVPVGQVLLVGADHPGRFTATALATLEQPHD